MADINFILGDLFSRLGGRTAVNQPDQSNRHIGIGHVYMGDRPPMAWVQEEQQSGGRSRDDASDAERSAQRLRELGNAAFKRGDFQEAMSHYTDSIELDPKNELSYTNRSLLYHRIGDFENAAQDARRAIELKADFYKGHYRLGNALMGLKQYDAAIDRFKEALDLCQSEVDRQEIQKNIAKCESKRARTPLKPPTTVKFAPATPTSESTCQFPSHTEPSVTAEHPPAVANMLDSSLKEYSGIAAEVDNIAKASNAIHSIGQVFGSSEESSIRCLIAQADPDRISKLAAEATQTQDALRSAVKSGDQRQFHAAVSARDRSYESLYKTTRETLRAVDQLLQMASGEKTNHKRLGELRNLQPVEKPGAPANGQPEPKPVSISEIPELSDEFNTLAQETFPVLNEHVTNVSMAAQNLLLAMNNLQDAYGEMKPKVDRQLDITNRLVASVSAHTPAELFPQERIDALQALKPRLQGLLSDEMTFKRSATEGVELLHKEASLEKERLRLERSRIQLQAELEWLAVKEEDDPPKIRRLRTSLDVQREDIRKIGAAQEEVRQRLLALMQSDHPELEWSCAAAGKKMMKWVKGSGLWTNASFSDYTVVFTLSSTQNSKVYHVKNRRGQDFALKEIPVESDKLRKRFQNEINIMAGVATHPNVMHLEGVFFDGPFAYILMPLHRRGSLKQLLQNETWPWFRMQEMFRQIVSAVAYLHERGIVHGDIKPSNILINDLGAPVLADFGIAKDIGRFGEKDVTYTATGSIAGTFDFMAPEQLDAGGAQPSTRSDMYSLGLSMLAASLLNNWDHDQQSSSPGLPLLLPENPGIDVSSHDVGGNDQLADLITNLLRRDPQQRLTAPDVLAHPFLCVSLIQDMVDNKQVVESNEKIAAFRTFVHALRGSRQPVLVSVVRNQMIESVSSIFSQFDEGALLRPLFVVFRGEEGIDEGALTTEMFQLYFSQLVSRMKALVTSSESDTSDGNSNNFQYGAQYLPSTDPHVTTSIYVTLGKALLKSIIENRPLPFQLSSVVFKHILGVPVTHHDLEEFDEGVANQLRHLVLMPAVDLEAMDLNFDEFPREMLEVMGVIPPSNSGANDEGRADSAECISIPVTAANVKQYVACKVQFELVWSRKPALDAIKEGFTSSSRLQPHIQLLTPTDLQLLQCGQQHIDAESIIRSLDFVEFSASSKTPEYLKELIRGFSQNNLRRFLRLCTAAVTVPAQGLPRKIRILSTSDLERLPVAHSCAFQLDLPDYNDKDVLRDKLGMALAHAHEGFFIV